MIVFILNLSSFFVLSLLIIFFDGFGEWFFTRTIRLEFLFLSLTRIFVIIITNLLEGLFKLLLFGLIINFIFFLVILSFQIFIIKFLFLIVQGLFVWAEFLVLKLVTFNFFLIICVFLSLTLEFLLFKILAIFLEKFTEAQVYIILGVQSIHLLLYDSKLRYVITHQQIPRYRWSAASWS